jgi:hypothetical protein
VLPPDADQIRSNCEFPKQIVINEIGAIAQIAREHPDEADYRLNYGEGR